MLKTPSAMDARGLPPKPNARPGDSGCLAQEMEGGYARLLPTPRATEIVEDPGKFARRNGDRTENSMPNLASMVKFRRELLPTPMRTEIRHRRRVAELKAAGGETFHSRKNGETRPNGLADFMDFHGISPGSGDGTDSRLNALFSAEMMGFPRDWLVLPFLSGNGTGER